MSLREDFNVDIKYPHEYPKGSESKLYNVSKEISFYDIVVTIMIGSFALYVGYGMVDEMEEKGFILLIFIFLGFCAFLS